MMGRTDGCSVGWWVDSCLWPRIWNLTPVWQCKNLGLWKGWHTSMNVSLTMLKKKKKKKGPFFLFSFKSPKTRQRTFYQGKTPGAEANVFVSFNLYSMRTVKGSFFFSGQWHRTSNSIKIPHFIRNSPSRKSQEKGNQANKRLFQEMWSETQWQINQST